jgi:serine-type D-Ala-D-Ala carboxypeptidase (penicillin-binding protein 5/6)
MQTSGRRAAITAASMVTAFAVTGYAMAASGPRTAGGPALAGAHAAAAAAVPADAAPAGEPPSVRQHSADRQARHGKDSARRPAHRRLRPAHRHPRPTHERVLHPRLVGGQRMGSSRIVVARHARPLPRVPASAYVIANARTRQVLAAKDAHGRYPPASTLKVLTAITMLPRLHPQARITASPLAASVVPNIIGVIPGHRYRVADLFRALLLISANDAAVALAQASGSFTKGIALMNAEAHHLQAYDVVARQPNGLPAAGQVVSAYDLALIARRALAIPAFMRYDRTLAATFSDTRFGPVRMVNENGLLTHYPGGLGGKTGWTAPAGATYVGMARRHGVTLIVTILHATPLTTIRSAERLLDWGFEASGRVRPVGTLVRPLSRR